jgi:hypothetical protein
MSMAVSPPTVLGALLGPGGMGWQVAWVPPLLFPDSLGVGEHGRMRLIWFRTVVNVLAVVAAAVTAMIFLVAAPAAAGDDCSMGQDGRPRPLCNGR